MEQHNLPFFLLQFLMNYGGFILLIVFLLFVFLGALFVMAPLKLYSIDRSMKQLLEEVKKLNESVQKLNPPKDDA